MGGTELHSLADLSIQSDGWRAMKAVYFLASAKFQAFSCGWTGAISLVELLEHKAAASAILFGIALVNGLLARSQP